MEITYKLDYDDLFNFTKYTIMRNKKNGGIFKDKAKIFYRSIFAAIISAGITYIVANIVLSPIGSYSFIIFYFIVTFILLLIEKGIAKRTLKKQIMDQNDIHLEFTFQMSDEGVCEITIDSNYFIKWEGIKSVEFDERNIYFYIKKYHAFVIPKNAFEKNEDIEEFQKLARVYWEKKHS